ncbi:glycosyltransferase 87 family protein [Streptomyces sp. NPDC002851]
MTSAKPALAPSVSPAAHRRRTGSRRRRARLGGLLALATAWAVTRAGMLTLLALDGRMPLGVGGIGREVHELYFFWYGTLRTGALPDGDPLWQYPPGAGPVLLSPSLLPGLSYFQGFVALTLATDAAIALALAVAGRGPGRTLRGAALWVGGLPLLLHIPLARYDIQVTALAVGALLALGTRAWRRSGGTRAWWAFSGALAAAGALVKVWPVLVLLGTPRGRTTRTVWTAALATAAALLLLLAALFAHPFGFLRQQGDRGVQIESFGGTLLAFAHRAGWPGEVRYQYGAVEFVGPYVSLVATASLLATALAGVALLVWRLRARRWTAATPADAALCAVLFFTVTSRVISPQYLVWLLGLTAVCLVSRLTAQRPVALLIVAAAGWSAVGYPVLYEHVMAGTWTGCLVLLVRNGLLATAAALSWRALWRSTATPISRTNRINS